MTVATQGAKLLSPCRDAPYCGGGKRAARPIIRRASPLPTPLSFRWTHPGAPACVSCPRSCVPVRRPNHHGARHGRPPLLSSCHDATRCQPCCSPSRHRSRPRHRPYGEPTRHPSTVLPPAPRPRRAGLRLFKPPLSPHSPPRLATPLPTTPLFSEHRQEGGAAAPEPLLPRPLRAVPPSRGGRRRPRGHAALSFSPLLPYCLAMHVTAQNWYPKIWAKFSLFACIASWHIYLNC